MTQLALLAEPLGRTFVAGEVELMQRICLEFSALGVTEIAKTVSELLDWR